MVLMLSYLAPLLLSVAGGSQPVFELYQTLSAPVIDSELAHAQSGGGAPNSGFEVSVQSAPARWCQQSI